MKNSFHNTLMVLISLIILAVLTIIAIKPNINMEHHEDYAEAFGQIEKYFLRSTENAYKTATGGIGHYDFLQGNLVKLKRFSEALEYAPDFLSKKQRLDLQKRTKNVVQEANTLDEDAIEFMRINSLLNNSKAYLPELIRTHKISESTMHMKQLLSFLEAQMYRFMIEDPSIKIRDIHTTLQSIDNFKENISQSDFVILRTHILLIVEYQGQVHNVLDKLSSSNLENVNEQAHDFYMQQFSEANNFSRLLTNTLIGLIALMFVLVATLMIQVRRASKQTEIAELELQNKLTELDSQKAIAEQKVVEALKAQEAIEIHQKQSDENHLKLNEAIESMSGLMSKVAQGDFTSRLDDNKFTGNLAPLKDSFHATLNELQAYMKELGAVSNSLSQGDLTQKIQGNYSGELDMVKNTLNSSLDKLSQLIGQVLTSASEIQTQITNVRSDSESVADSSTKQAQTLNSTIQAVDETTDKIRLNTQNTQKATEITNAQVTALNDGLEVMHRMTSAMDDIKESSEKIVDIINLIDSIAFQTNLLALNAAVEAARAGEQGRGFAVVAGEVRSLAGKSADAAKDISDLISNSNEKVNNGAQLVNHVNDSLEMIKEKVEDLKNSVTEINEASYEQSNSAQNITHAVSEAENISNHNTQLIQKTADQVNLMSNSVQRLEDIVKTFKI